MLDFVLTIYIQYNTASAIPPDTHSPFSTYNDNITDIKP